MRVEGERADAYRQHLKTAAEKCEVPEYLHDGVIEYLVSRRPTGHFLKAVLSNDLREAIARADVENRVHLYELVLFLHNYAPAPAWGSPSAVDAWLDDPSAPPVVFE